MPILWRSVLYRIAEIFAVIGGIFGIIISIMRFFEITLGEGWFFIGFGIQVGWGIIALISSIFVLLGGLGHAFTDIGVLILGILVLIASIFMPGIAGLFGFIAGILFIIEAILF